MKRLFTFASLISLFLTACGTASTPTVSATSVSSVVPTIPAALTQVSLPVVKVDQAHMDTSGLNYIIPAGAGFIFDASGFNFKLPNGQAASPTAIQIVAGSRAYQSTWTAGATSQTVNAAELTPVANAQPLTQFESGMQLIVSIGLINSFGHYQPLWVAVISVQ